MPRQQVEFEFPDPDKEAVAAAEIEVALDEEDAPLEVEGAVGREYMKKPSNVIKAGDVEIEVEDDTPPGDRGKTPSDFKEASDEELERYSNNVKKRMKQLNKLIHDERRAKEAAFREREELERFARPLIEENEQLRARTDQNTLTMLEQAKVTVAAEMAAAKRQYKDAYESGDTDAILEAQEALTTAKIRSDKVANFKPAPLQRPKTPVQVPQQAPEPAVSRDERASSWAEENSWFGSDDEMTAFALGLDTKLKKEGIDPQSDTYYERINSRMRQVFPDQFDEEAELESDEAPVKKRASNVVAPATRSTAPKKVTLTRTQVALAKKLGVPLDLYAQKVAEEMRKQS
jgi:hypothetical protein